MEEAMLVFFYDGVCPWIRDIGYKWSQDDHIVAKKFLHLCYMIDTTAKMYDKDIQIPTPRHRNLQEDRETFDYFADSYAFNQFLDYWFDACEIIGTRLDYLLREFCYLWINVEAGKPGTFTQKVLTAEEENASDEEHGVGIPDGNWSRRKHDLY
jgi:hypothetical protein